MSSFSPYIDTLTLRIWVLSVCVLRFSGGREKRVVHQLLWHRTGEGRDDGRSQRHPPIHYFIKRQQVRGTRGNFMTTYTDLFTPVTMLHAGQSHVTTYLKPELEARLSVYQSYPDYVQRFKRSKLGHAFSTWFRRISYLYQYCNVTDY